MINYTNTEIKNKVIEIFDLSPNIITNEVGYVKFEITSTSLSLTKLFKLCQFFDTQEIDEVSEIRDGGYCPTCSYEYTVLVFTVVPTKDNERLYNRLA